MSLITVNVSVDLADSNQLLMIAKLLPPLSPMRCSDDHCAVSLRYERSEIDALLISRGQEMLIAAGLTKYADNGGGLALDVPKSVGISTMRSVCINFRGMKIPTRLDEELS